MTYSDLRTKYPERDGQANSGDVPRVKQASRIILAGDSSGAVGIQNQGDLLAKLVRSLIGPSIIDIRIFRDSGWFQPGPGYIPDYCAFTDSLYCN